MSSKIKEKKQEKENKKKVVSSNDKKGIVDFFKGVLNVFITLLLWAFLGSSVITTIKYLGKQEYLPTDTKEYPYAPTKRIIDPKTNQPKMIASFPYNYISKKTEEKGSFTNWILETLAKTMALDRKSLKYTFNKLKGGLQISKLTHSTFMKKHSKLIDKVVSSLLFFLTPFLVIILSLISYFIGTVGFTYKGFMNTDNIFYKIFIIISFFFGFTNIFGVYSSFSTIFFLLFKSFDIFDKNIKIKNVLDTIKENTGALSLLFMVLIVNQAFQHLPQGAAIGILVGFLLMNVGVIMKIIL